MFDRAMTLVPCHAASRRAAVRNAGLGLLALGVAACVPVKPVDAPPRSVVFFTAFSANLDDNANRALSEIADDAKTNPRRSVVIEGYADKVGTPMANVQLSQLRAQVVADALVARGVDRTRIVMHPRGPTDADPGIESRRVDVTYGP